MSETFDDGIVVIKAEVDVSEPGGMPKKELVELSRHMFQERTIGITRQYAAKSVDEQVDRLVRIWEDRRIHIGMMAEIAERLPFGYEEVTEQYRIDNVQHLLNDDGLKVTDLTLKRLEDLYDIDDAEQVDSDP